MPPTTWPGTGRCYADLSACATPFRRAYFDDIIAVRAALLGTRLLGVVSLAVFAVAIGAWLVDKYTSWVGR